MLTILSHALFVLPFSWTSVKIPPVRLAMSAMAALAFGSMRATQLMMTSFFLASLPIFLAMSSVFLPAVPSVMKKMMSGCGVHIESVFDREVPSCAVDHRSIFDDL